MARRYEFYFRVVKQYFTSERSEWVKYCFCHENYVIEKLTCETPSLPKAQTKLAVHNYGGTDLCFRSDNESAEDGIDFWSSLWQDMHGKISTRSWLVRLDLFWLYGLYFQLLINWTGGRVHVNLYLDFSRAYPQKWLTCWKKENSVMTEQCSL